MKIFILAIVTIFISYITAAFITYMHQEITATLSKVKRNVKEIYYKLRWKSVQFELTLHRKRIKERK